MDFPHLDPELREQARRLHRRYRRFFKVDLVLHALYGISGCIPLWGLIQHRQEILFHSLGFIAVLSVSILGILANFRLLKGSKGGFTLGLATTALFLITRATIIWWAIFVYLDLDISDTLGYQYSFGILIIFFLSLYLFYRLLYHISAYCHTRMFL